MRLSTKGRYAVMAMADLACAQSPGGMGAGGMGAGGSGAGERAVSLADIARRQDISLAYLEQLFARLRRAGLVDSQRGPGGGYRLTRAAAATTLADIVAAVDEPVEVLRCVGPGAGCLPGGARCLTHDLWAELDRRIHAFLDDVSLADVVGRRFAADLAPAAAAAVRDGVAA